MKRVIEHIRRRFVAGLADLSGSGDDVFIRVSPYQTEQDAEGCARVPEPPDDFRQPSAIRRPGAVHVATRDGSLAWRRRRNNRACSGVKEVLRDATNDNMDARL